MRWPPLMVVLLVLQLPGGLQVEPMIFAPRLLASSIPNPVRFPEGFIPTRKMDMPMALGPSRPKRSSHGSDELFFNAVLKPNPWMFWRVSAVCTVTPLTSPPLPPPPSVVAVMVSPVVVLVAPPVPLLVTVAPVLPVTVVTAVVPVTVVEAVVPVTAVAPVVPVVPEVLAVLLTPFVLVVVLPVVFAPGPVEALVSPLLPESEHAAAARRQTLTDKK